MYPLKCCGGKNNSVVKISGKCYDTDPDDQYMCCPTGVGAVGGSSWGSCCGYCCEEGTIPTEVDLGYICCKPGETGYSASSRECCPAGYNVDKSAWPHSCCPPDKETCPGGYHLGGNKCCEPGKCCLGECCGENETCEIYEWPPECVEWENIFDENGELVGGRCVREETWIEGYCY